MARISGRRTWTIVIAGGILGGALALAGGMIGTGPGVASAVVERPAQPVRVSIIAFAEPKQAATYTGTIRPRHEVAMGFRIAGKVVSRGVEVGDRVTQGQELALLDDTDARLQAELAAAEDAAARVDHTRVRAEADRSRQLYAEGHVAQATLDRAVSAEAEAASRALRAARAVALARNGLGYTRLVADADGVVTATPGEVGQVVAAGTPVVSVARTGAVDVVFPLPETDRPLLEGNVARGTVWGDEAAEEFALSLRDISPDVDPLGRTYRVRMSLEHPVGAADFGRTVTVTVAMPPTAPVAAVPLAAVVDDGAGPGVWRVTGDKVERVAVEVASVSGEIAAIRGALKDGEVIVSLGAHKVDPARPVRIVETASALVE